MQIQKEGKVVKMHPVNRLLSLFGLQISRTKKKSPEEESYKKQYRIHLEKTRKNTRGFKVCEAYRYNIGKHPFSCQDLEFEFAAHYIRKAKPKKILDIGSHRHFLLGLLAYYNITTIDIRERKSGLDNETIMVCDAKCLSIADNSFDLVLSLETLPHIGLGRYGDEFDLDADIKAFNEMKRVLKPSGYLIFSTAITGGEPLIAFNARRNYNYKMIKDLCEGLKLIDERFIDRKNLRIISLEELTKEPCLFDYYIGCWEK